MNLNKLDIKKLFNVETTLNNLKTKLDDLDIVKLKIVPMDLKKLSDVVSKEFAKNTKFNKLNTKVNILEDKVSDATTLIGTN